MKENLSSEKDENRVPILIDAKLYRDIQNEISSLGFGTIDEYVNYILRVAVGKKSMNPNRQENETQQEQTAMTTEESEIVFNRLKALGYM